MEISNTDANAIIRYLEDAARLMDGMKEQRHIGRGSIMVRMAKKLKRKLNE